MRLLLDEMISSEIAEQLRQRGHDVVAIVERAELRGWTDAAVFDLAQREERVVLTENAGDYRVLAAARLTAGGMHHGLILTSNRRFPRGDARATGRLVNALHDLLEGGEDLTNRESWLTS